jgi:hypothetical protein
VKETPAAHMLDLVRAHIEKQGYRIGNLWSGIVTLAAMLEM